MNDLYLKALKAYTDMLTIHIKTKTKDSDFHNETEKFYEALFDVAHEIWEKDTDLHEPISDVEFDNFKKAANNIIKNLREDIERFHKENEVSLWTEDLLWSLANKLENIEWTSKSFLK